MYLLDTNHCSYILSGNKKIADKLTTSTDDLSTCAVVVGELHFMVKNSDRKGENAKKINQFLNAFHEVYDLNSQTADLYGQLKSDLINEFGPKEKKEKRKYK